MKRLLFLTHRWAGIVIALFMLLWFFTGLIIAYSSPLVQSRAQQLAHAQALSPEPGWLSLGEAWQRSAEARKALYRPNSPESPITDARLLRAAGEPQWLVEDDRNRRFAVSAIDGELRNFSVEQAQRIAQEWLAADRPGERPAITYLDTLEATSSLRNYTEFKPFHRFVVDDGAGTELLISARTGDVLQAATSFERGLYWAGNWLHFFRPLDALGAGDYRRDALTWVSFAATLGVLTGLIAGWLRWRPGWFGRPTYASGDTQPFRAFWMRWHFWTGLIGGSFALFWAFSGFLTNNPWQIFSPATPSREELARYQGTKVPEVIRNWRPQAASKADGGAGTEVAELDWRRLGDQAVLLAYTRDGNRLPQNVAGTASQFDEATLLAAAQRLADGTKIAAQTLQQDYDSYYYPTHHQGLAEKPLPVLHVELADPGHTHLYLDPQDGRLLSKQDSSRRAFRWLVGAVHHWDFGWLYYRPLWDAWMLTWIGFGLVLSASSVVIGWRRLRITFGFGQKSRRKAPRSPELAAASEA